MVGVAGTSLDTQLNFVRQCQSSVKPERLQKGNTIHSTACQANGEAGYGKIEAEFLHCFITKIRPKKIIQIGCGVSTSVILQAAQEAGYQPEIVTVEPYPTNFLLQKQQEGKIKLIQEKAQKVPVKDLVQLGENDLFFVDSTHTVKVGSEVNYLILEVLQQLPKNCYVHFHDIYFPYDYQRNTLSTELFFNKESSLLHAFLIGNQKYEIAASLSMLHYANNQVLQSLFPNYIPQTNDEGLRHGSLQGEDFPSATYLKTLY
jgi:hypothetical protein